MVRKKITYVYTVTVRNSIYTFRFFPIGKEFYLVLYIPWCERLTHCKIECLDYGTYIRW